LHIVRYEDMTYKPGPTFKGIAKFMGLKPPAEALKRAIKLSSFDSVRSQEDDTGFIERSVHAQKFFRVGKANQWKSVLSKEQIDKVVEGNYDMMKKFNYLPPEYK
ncbi:MAG: sulfotransferase domain-containing protein, partial [Alphaproteobacteria bacterium]|nr:sulfotransferase domain-containing protein [Alphaproteobacteria bacterium]